MTRETEFQNTIKWFVYGTAGLCALCQIILLFIEFSFFNGIGMFLNGLFHLSGVAAPVLIFILFFRMNDEKEVYSSYVLALNSFLGAVIDLVILIKYIINMNTTKGFNAGVVIGLIMLFIVEVFFGLILIWYGLDKVTSVLPLLTVIVTCIFKGCMLSVVDSAFITYAYNSVKGTVFSVWTFMYLMLYLSFVVCLILYLDSDNLLEVIRNPKDIFTKNTFFGTYTNLYLKDDKKKEINTNTYSATAVTSQNQMIYQPMQDQSPGQLGQAIGVCPDCGNVIYINQNMCSACGCPSELVVNYNTNQNETSQTMMNYAKSSISTAQNIDNTNHIIGTELQALNNNDQVSNNLSHTVDDKKQVIDELSNTADVNYNKGSETPRKIIRCPDCGNEVDEGVKMCNKCGCPL